MFLLMSDMLATNVVVALAAGLLGLGGIISALLFVTDEGISRKAVFSTVILMVGVVLAAVSFYFDANAEVLVFRFVHAFVLITFVLLAVLLAVLGLLDIWGKTHAARKGGLFVGITLGLGTMAACLGGFEVYRIGTNDVNIAAVDYDAKFQENTKDDAILKAMDDESSKSTDQPEKKPYEKLAYAKQGVEEMPYYNCRFTSPGQPYREAKIDISKDHKRKQMVYIWYENEVSVQIDTIRGWAGSARDYALQQIDARQQARRDMKLMIEPELQLLNGVPGQRFELEINGQRFGERLYQAHWCTIHNGFRYHLVASGSMDKRFTVVEESKKWFTHFEIMNHDKIVFEHPDAKPVENEVYENPSIGLKVVVPDKKWGHYQYEHEGGSPALFQSTQIIVNMNRVYVGDIVPDVAHLSKTLLELYTRDFENKTRPVPLKYEGVEEGIGLIMKRDAQFMRYGKPTPGYVQVFYQKPYVYTFYAATYNNDESTQDAVKDVLKQFKIVKPPSTGVKAFDPKYKHIHITVLNVLANHYFQKSLFEESRACHRLLFELLPDDRDVLFRYMASLTQQIDPAEAAKIAMPLKPKLGDDYDLNVLFIRIMLNQRNLEAAAERMKVVYASGQMKDTMMKDYVEVLVSLSEPEQAARLCKAYIDKQPQVNPFVRAAYVLAVCRTPGREDEGEKLIRELLELNVNDPNYQGYVLGLISEYGNPVDGLRLMERLEQQFGELGDLRMYRVEFLIKLKRYQEAMDDLEILEQDAPTSRPIQEKIAFLKSRMSDTRYAFEDVHIDPLPLPKALEKLPELKDETLVKEHDYYILRNDVVYSFKTGEPHTRTVYQTIVLRDIRAVDRLNMLPIEFNPKFEDVAVNRLEVYDAKGRLVGKGDIDEYFITDVNDGVIMSDDKRLVVPVPGLKKDSRIELVYTVKDNFPLDQFPYTAVTMYTYGTPKVRQSVSYLGDPKLIQYTSSMKDDPKSFEQGIYWSYDNIKPLKYEFMTRYRPEDLPELTIAPTSTETWEALGLSYLDDVKERLTIDPETKTLADKITLGAASEKEKVDRLARYVQREIDYEALEFGQRAWMMNTPQKILKDGFGDCKDHSILLWQLLHSVGIEAHMTLIHTESKLNARYPAMSQFDHMIVYVPGYEGGRMIDVTGKSTPPTMPVPFGLRGMTGLVLHPEKPYLKPVGEYPVTREGIYIKRSIEVTRVTNDMIVKEVVTVTGVNAIKYRNALARIRPEDYKIAAGNWFGDEQNRFRVIRMHAENVNDPSKPLKIELDYSYNRVFRRVGNELIGTLPTTWERISFQIQPVDNRETYFGSTYPLLMQVEINVKSPFGFKVKTDRDLSKRVSLPSLKVATQSTIEKDGLKISTAIVETPGYYPPEQYEAYYKAVMDFRATTAADIRLELTN